MLAQGPPAHRLERQTSGPGAVPSWQLYSIRMLKHPVPPSEFSRSPSRLQEIMAVGFRQSRKNTSVVYEANCLMLMQLNSVYIFFISKMGTKMLPHSHPNVVAEIQ